jgi:hypothetical protein
MRPFARPIGLPPLSTTWTLPDSWHFPVSHAAFLQPGLPVEYAMSLTEPDYHFNGDPVGGYWDPDDPLYAQISDSFAFSDTARFRHSTFP